jgi:hypothetical protein
MSCLAEAREMGQPWAFGSSAAQRRETLHSSAGSSQTVCSVGQVVPSVSPVQLGMLGSSLAP